MGKIKLNITATIEETFKDFIVSRKTKGLAEKTLVSYQSQFQSVARHLDVSMDIAALKKADLESMLTRPTITVSNCTLSPAFLLIRIS